MNTQAQLDLCSHATSLSAVQPVGIGLCDTQTLQFVTVNRPFLSLLHRHSSPSCQDGQLFDYAFPDYLVPDFAQPLLDALTQVSTTGNSISLEFYTHPNDETHAINWHCTLEPVFVKQQMSHHVVMTIHEGFSSYYDLFMLKHQQTVSQRNCQRWQDDQQRLTMVETIALKVQSSLDMRQTSHNIIEAIKIGFAPVAVALYHANAERQRLELLQNWYFLSIESTAIHADSIPYDSQCWFASIYKQYEPSLGHNDYLLPTETDCTTIITGEYHSASIPLWYDDKFEGALTITFAQPIAPDGVEIQALRSCSHYIAVALAHARQYTEVMHERSQLRAVIDQLPEGILIIDANEHIRYINAAGASITRLPITQHINIQAKDHPLTSTATTLDGKSTHYQNFPALRALRGETVQDDESIVQRIDGSVYYNQSSAVPLRAEDGTITGALAIFRDITEQKRIEQHKQQFLSIASHELRTPITAIQGFAELLHLRLQQEDQLDTQRALYALTGIIKYSQHLTRLIEDLLDISRLEIDQLFINCTVHNLLTILNQVIEAQTLTTHRHTIRYVLDGLTATTTLPVCVDYDRIVQVFNNLLNNAIKYSPAGGDIEVGIRREEDVHCLIWVKDQGIGINPHELPHIFKRFHRAHNLDRSIAGLGIGLHLVQELITRHQGQIWVESTPGQGSTFFVRLPLCQET